MGRTAETRGGVAAIFGTRFGDRRFGSVAGMVGVQQPCHELRGEVAHEGPSCPESQRRSRDFVR